MTDGVGLKSEDHVPEQLISRLWPHIRLLIAWCLLTSQLLRPEKKGKGKLRHLLQNIDDVQMLVAQWVQMIWNRRVHSVDKKHFPMSEWPSTQCVDFIVIQPTGHRALMAQDFLTRGKAYLRVRVQCAQERGRERVRGKEEKQSQRPIKGKTKDGN